VLSRIHAGHEQVHSQHPGSLSSEADRAKVGAMHSVLRRFWSCASKSVPSTWAESFAPAFPDTGSTRACTRRRQTTTPKATERRERVKILTSVKRILPFVTRYQARPSLHDCNALTAIKTRFAPTTSARTPAPANPATASVPRTIGRVWPPNSHCVASPIRYNPHFTTHDLTMSSSLPRNARPIAPQSSR
jgi:hypothetical protein